MCFGVGNFASLLGVWVYDRVLLIAIANKRHRCHDFVKTLLSSMLLIEVMPSL